MRLYFEILLAMSIQVLRSCMTSLLLLGVWAPPVLGQGKPNFPSDLIPPTIRPRIQLIVDQSDFQFQTSTLPKKVKLATMEKLFDHPRLSASLWRQCQFVPAFFAFEETRDTFVINDTQGLTGRLTLIYSVPGHRIYWVEGHADTGRLKPFAPSVSAQMITSYRYWETEKGFETRLETWTKLDNSLLGLLAQPFKKYVKNRQDEFINYINNNIALFGESTELNFTEFRDSIFISTDPRLLNEFNKLYKKTP